MRPLCTALLASVLVLTSAVSGQANTQLFASLTNSAEFPPTNPTTGGANPQPRPASFGVAFFDLNDARTAMTFNATIFNIDFTGSQTADTNDNLTIAHIHANATASPTGPTFTAGVVWGFFGTPFNDNNPNDIVFTPFPAGSGLVGGTISGKWDAPEGNNTTLAAQIPNILNGHSYINFHTVQFGGGEIRGFLTVIPEPTTNVLLGVGAVAGLLGFGWRRNRWQKAA
jgi:hypothetical protein